jgi:hypothetical protein
MFILLRTSDLTKPPSHEAIGPLASTPVYWTMVWIDIKV